MGRKKLWLGDFVALKVKIYNETHARYLVALKGKSIQQDLEEHIINVIRNQEEPKKSFNQNV